ncbi:exonuclease domain-containing protein [Pistricoccus aurantiacus]|uniref:exonuclease domain-containing protein n=1 Tax=Pistricoccus aurantiacus TaxID=1883414 RepID=UPI00363591E9
MFKTWRRIVDRRRQSDGYYGWLFNPYTGNELVAIDCETTGPDPRSAELVAIGAIKLRDARLLVSDALELRLTPPASLAGNSIRFHGLRRIDLENGIERRDALQHFLEFVGNRPLVSWGIDFDLMILNRYLRAEFDFELPNARLDVAKRYAQRQRCAYSPPEPAPCFKAACRSLDIPLIQRSPLGNAMGAGLLHLRLAREVRSPSLATLAAPTHKVSSKEFLS